MPRWTTFKKRCHESIRFTDEENYQNDNDFINNKKKYFTLITCTYLMLTLACIFIFVIIFIWVNYINLIKTQPHYLKSNSCIPYDYNIEFIHRGHGATVYKGYLKTIVQMTHNTTHIVTHCNENKYNIFYGYDNSKNILEKKLKSIVLLDNKFTCYIQNDACEGVININYGSSTKIFGITMTVIACAFLLASFGLYFLAKKRHRINYILWRLDDIDDVYSSDDDLLDENDGL